MNSQSPFTPKNLITLKSHWGWFFVLGLALIVLGVFAIGAAFFTTILSVILLGIIIAIAGIAILLDTFQSWWNEWGGFFLHLIIGLLYIAAGTLLINKPLLGSISITLLLGIFYTIVGISRLISYSTWKTTHWGWGFFNGLISLLLGVLILANWPSSSLYIIGLFVGIDLLVVGWTYMMISLAARNYMK